MKIAKKLGIKARHFGWDATEKNRNSICESGFFEPIGVNASAQGEDLKVTGWCFLGAGLLPLNALFALL